MELKRLHFVREILLWSREIYAKMPFCLNEKELI